MAFLDNSGDIILDAVLTDAGRKRMAQGDFRIEKFALGDEEVNYNLYVKNHASGSAFSDLDIMQTPILEALTNNTSTMKTKLFSITRNNILYMPIFKLNDRAYEDHSSLHALNNGFLITADNYTTTLNGDARGNGEMGIFYGDDTARVGTQPCMVVDQGIETGNAIPISNTLDGDLLETAYLVRVDYRLLRLHGASGDNADLVDFSAEGNIAFIDDDSIASYYIQSTNPSVRGHRSGVHREKLRNPNDVNEFEEGKRHEVFNGPVGNRLQLRLRTSMDLQHGSTLFDEIGSSTASGTLLFRGKKITNYKFIDTLVNVTGVTTGQSIDIPVRIIKANASGWTNP